MRSAWSASARQRQAHKLLIACAVGVIEKFSFAMRKSALFLSSYESEPLDSLVLRTGIELEPGRHPAHASAENVQRPPRCRAEPDTLTGHPQKCASGTQITAVILRHWRTFQ